MHSASGTDFPCRGSFLSTSRINAASKPEKRTLVSVVNLQQGYLGKNSLGKKFDEPS
jgi:hypothetical protein